MSSSIFNGLLLVKKPSGCTSHDLVARARKIFKTKAVGHCGTLDPLASGLMVLLLNEATKLSQYILEGDKGYTVKIKFGVTTDTLDITGQVIEEKPVHLDKNTIISAAEKLTGEFQWPVPIYSAVKVQGKKLYDYARHDEEVVTPIKTMKFWDLYAQAISHDEATFAIKCSKGSYIRTWVDQLGKNLGCGAVMIGLERTWSDPYSHDQALSLEEIESQLHVKAHSEALVPIIKALPKVKIVKVKGHDQKLLTNGQISHDLRSLLIQKVNPFEDHLMQIFSYENQLLAIIGLEPGKGFHIKRIFQY